MIIIFGSNAALFCLLYYLVLLRPYIVGTATLVLPSHFLYMNHLLCVNWSSGFANLIECTCILKSWVEAEKSKNTIIQFLFYITTKHCS